MVWDQLEFLTLTLTEFFLFFCRRTVAEAVTEEVLQQFRMYHEAGLPDFAFMRRVRSKGTHTHAAVVYSDQAKGVIKRCC